jgi:hypothetical protein
VRSPLLTLLLLLALHAHARAQDTPPGAVLLAGRRFLPIHTLATTSPSDLPTVRYRLLIQAPLAAEADEFALTVHQILQDPDHWAAAGLQLAPAQGDDFDITVLLAEPEVVDLLCAPLNTGRALSCAQGRRANLNVTRWRTGARTWPADDLRGYRQYLVLHEVGHLLGLRHQRCPGPGQLAPIMMQQSRRITPCLPNDTPTPDEITRLKALFPKHTPTDAPQ